MRSLPLSALVELARSDFAADPAARRFLLAVGSARGRARLRFACSERRLWAGAMLEYNCQLPRCAPWLYAGELVGGDD